METEYGVVAAFGELPSTNRTTPLRLVAAEPIDACAPLKAPLDGGVALTRRGGCSFVTKYLAVLAAGGSAMLMFNDAPGEHRRPACRTRCTAGRAWPPDGGAASEAEASRP